MYVTFLRIRFNDLIGEMMLRVFCVVAADLDLLMQLP
jgi:hypothetical protein